MNTLIIYISDIHFTGSRPENEGVVINAFLIDVKKQLEAIPHQDVFLFIGGDLVQTADNKESYEGFWNDVIMPLLALGIKKEHIVCVPGNHDIQRQKILESKIVYASLVSQEFSEAKFNDLLESDTQVPILTNKFENYKSFLTEKLEQYSYNDIGYQVELNDEWSVYCMNSSLTSFAGIVDSDNPLLKDDKGRLNIASRALYEWLSVNSKKKILLLHHPFEFLTEWSILQN